MVRALGKRAILILYGIFFLFAFWVAYALVYGKGGMIERKKVMKQLDQLRAEIGQLEKESQYLDWQIKNLRTNRRFIESFARELGFKKEGEIIFRFMKKKDEPKR